MSCKEAAFRVDIPETISKTFSGPNGENEVLNIPGISLYQKREERPNHEDCVEYIFPGENYDLFKKVLQSSPLQYAVPRSIVAYYEKDDPDDIANWVPTHVGQMADDGEVISKWGFKGHVYKHKLNCVLVAYGQIIKYFLPRSEK
jgi:hypothetical protein